MKSSLVPQRRYKMRISSYKTIATESENAKRRQLSIQKSWSKSEREERRRLAIESQLRLVSLLTMEGRKPGRINVVTELVAC